MCKNCKSSELGIAREAELAAATAQCKELNINPSIAGFLVKHAYGGYTPRHERLSATPEQIVAVERYNAAQSAMKKLHEDYVWERGRAYVEEMRARGVKPMYITHEDRQNS